LTVFIPSETLLLILYCETFKFESLFAALYLLYIFKTLNAIRCPSAIALADDFGTLKWEEVFKYPGVALEQMQKLVT